MVKVGCKVFIGSVLLWIALSGSSCQLQQVPQEGKAVVPVLDTIVLIGFRPGMAVSQTSGVVRSPICGAVHSEHYKQGRKGQ